MYPYCNIFKIKKIIPQKLLEAGADSTAKNKINKTAAMMCGFVGMKLSHRILNCWVTDVKFLNDLYTANSTPPTVRRKVQRLICHPNCLPISILQRIGSLQRSLLRFF